MRVSQTLKFLDRYLGIPLVFLLGCLRRKNPLPPLGEAPNIALLQTAAIGDTILLSGIVADLKKRWPKSTLTLFAGSSNWEAAQLIPGIQVVLLPVTSPLRAIPILSAQSFDLWLDCGSWPRLNALYSFFAKARYKIGFQTPGQYRHFVYDATALHQPIHEMENLRHLLRLLQIASHHPPQLVALPITPLPFQIALHLYGTGVRAPLREWPEERWITLIDTLAQRGFSLVLTGSSADRARCERVKRQCRYPASIQVTAGELSLRGTAELFCSSAAVISVDTGTMHLASSLGCLTVALHGPTASQRWGGIGPRVISLRQTIKSPCLYLGFERRCVRCHCMNDIRVEHVLEVLDEELNPVSRRCRRSCPAVPKLE